MSEEIIKNNCYSIYYYNNNSKRNTIIICFDDMFGNFKKKGFGVNFFLKYGFEVAFVSHKKGSFFQELTESELYNCLKDYISGKEVITYGTSLGGYAALYYSSILGAKAIAFSPRCSIDPIYSDSERFNIEFKHTPLNEKLSSLSKKPIVIIDDNVKKDKIFFEKRILPAYSNDIVKVSLVNATHHTPKALLEIGKLKDFVLEIVINNNIIEVDFDFNKSIHCLSHLAWEKARNKDFDEANLYLEKILSLEQFLKPTVPFDEMRMVCYRILIENSRISHKFNKKLIIDSERSNIIKRHIKKMRDHSNIDAILRSQFDMHTLLMEYSNAVVLAESLCFSYPEVKEYQKILNQAKKNIINAEGWIT